MKKLLMVVVSLILVMSFAACATSTPQDSSNTTKNDPESVAFVFDGTTVQPGTYDLTATVSPAAASQDVTFTIIGTVAGVSIENNKLVVSENAADGTTFRVKAAVKTDPTVSATLDLTVDNPAPDATMISTEAELRAMDLAGSYKLANDITLTSAWTPLGTPDNSDEGIPGTGFSGTFNGNGYKIKNINITGTWNAGFFAQIDATGVVKNVGFESEEGEGKGVSGNAWCGVVAGINHGLIENCYANVQVRMNGCPGAAFTGANVGETAVIKDCYAVGKVYVGEGNHGACFTGSNDGGQIVNSYFLETSGNAAIGWNKGQDASIQKSKTWMTTANNYVEAGWDANVWSLVDGYYPMLKYEGFVAPTPVMPDPELSITNSQYIDYDTASTLQVTYSLSNVTDDSVTYALQETVTGVSLSDTGLITLADTVADGTKFTVVVTSVEVTTLSASLTFTVNRATDAAVAISSFDDLLALAASTNPADMAKNYVLTADIDASTTWFNTAIGANSATAFTGTFDGNGYTISGIAGGNEANDYGLFKEIGAGGVVRNLGIAIREGRNLCANRMGAVASVNKGTISNVIITGEIWCTDVGAGGVVWDNHGVIEYVVMLAKVNHYYTEANSVGAITYYQQEGASITNCFVDAETTGLTSLTRTAGEDAACMTTAAMKTAATFSAFDTDVWNIADGSYPSLKKGL